MARQSKSTSITIKISDRVKMAINEAHRATVVIALSWLLLLVLTTCFPASASPLQIPSLGVLRGANIRDTNNTKSSDDDFKTFFYTQTLDHFNYRPESYRTFPQKYFINDRFWGGASSNAPIFAYLGAESSLHIENVWRIGFLPENAARFRALLVYIEHRYYGESIPFGSREEAFKDANNRGYLSSSQALADYAEILTNLKKNLSAETSPVIVIGGSYGGMLASWFRLKYPHIALGALASSAPILYFDDITPQDGYYSIVTKDFREASETCYNTIKQSWSLIDEIASKPNGISLLSNKFKTCNPLNTSSDIKAYLHSMYVSAAQYNAPPRYPVTEICRGIDGASEGTHVLSRVFAGLVASKGNLSCYDTHKSLFPNETLLGWRWQTCSEMVFPIGRNRNDSMFPVQPFNLSSFIEHCKSEYGVPPRPHWITTEFGGQHIKLILKKFASNIIFSNGLRDPYSSGGVLEDISDTILSIRTTMGSHCLDIISSREDDPKWLVMQRNIEIKIIKSWIANYYVDLLSTS